MYLLKLALFNPVVSSLNPPLPRGDTSLIFLKTPKGREVSVSSAYCVGSSGSEAAVTPLVISWCYYYHGWSTAFPHHLAAGRALATASQADTAHLTL
ncbi:hypothetical protein E2C01_097789 [Portunus trituberculatus]|uniref:Uncharacterized protein n=1 Tax=Portunus trituberculatus TaxID=210409 RepID=A0A5B7JW42_PORTR|nr:hypothetical protein [Portunus trituberculatus]